MKELTKHAFQFVFNVEPIPFGKSGDKVIGYSDGAQGVQWNICINENTNTVCLGVNLEGLGYSDQEKNNQWPITKYLLKESKQLTLLSLTGIDSADKITIKMSRDAWQVRMRPLIKEQDIAPKGLKLSDLTAGQWLDIINESLSCLSKEKQYKGRAKQIVNRIDTGTAQIMQVCPHLGFKTVVTTVPISYESFITNLQNAKKILLPLYRYVVDQT